MRARIRSGAESPQQLDFPAAALRIACGCSVRARDPEGEASDDDEYDHLEESDEEDKEEEQEE